MFIISTDYSTISHVYVKNKRGDTDSAMNRFRSCQNDIVRMDIAARSMGENHSGKRTVIGAW